MALRCAHCGADIPAANVNVAELVAKCSACNHVFRIDTTRLPSGEGLARGDRPTPPLLPDGITVERTEAGAADPTSIFAYRDSARDAPHGTLRLTRRWRDPGSFLLLFFSIFWNGFLVVWYGLVFSMDPIPWIMVFFPLIHVAVGVGLTYGAVAGLSNRTVVEVDAEQLRVRHGPLPWRGDRALPSRSLRQLYIRRKQHRKGGSAYAIHAALDDLSTVELLSGLNSLDQARYVEWAVEDFLRIQNDPEYDGL